MLNMIWSGFIFTSFKTEQRCSDYLAGVGGQLGLHGEGAPGDRVPVVGHVDCVDPFLRGRVAHPADARPRGLRLRFDLQRPLAGTQLETKNTEDEESHYWFYSGGGEKIRNNR